MNKKLFLLLISVMIFAVFGEVDAQSSEKLIQDFYQKENWMNKKDDASGKTNVMIINEDYSESLGVRIVNIQQTHNGLRIFDALGKVLIKNNKIISEKNDFKRSLQIADQPKVQSTFSEDFLKQKLNLNKISKMKYFPDLYFEKNGKYILAKEIIVYDKNSSDVWHVIANAASGEILSKSNRTLSCRFEQNEDLKNSSAQLPLNYKKNVQAKTSFRKGLPPSNASYNVFALPTEAPTFGSRSIINNPWDLTASPEGWHSDGTNAYTITRGNNVYAYSDQDNNNEPGYSPTGGSALTFDFPFADGRYDNPFTYRDAAITNLFYTNNKLHDVFYKFGFTESARNYQTNNFGRGGLGNDAVEAEAFDGSGLNNAYFDSGYEQIIGPDTVVGAPRMQMYLYTRSQPSTDPISRYKYNAPASMTTRAKVTTGAASFGPIYGSAVTANIKVAVPANACTEPAQGSLDNKIALITNAGCQHSLKVLNAQKAGAVGVIVYNPSSNTVVGMGAGEYGDQVTIPSIYMGKNEGQFIVTTLNSGTQINATLDFDYSGFKNSSFDNLVIGHEYGHGISNRLTGVGEGCLNGSISKEQMGEGWSDYFGLMLTTRPGDTSFLARGIATYPYNTPNTAEGIRLAKYSPDFSVNNYTYAKTNTMSGQQHSIGFVWATMLWDLTWKYIEKYGYNSDVLASATSGNAKALQVVINGLKLQVCNPTFIDGRDAILQADAVGNAGADKCMIWRAFARRGLGVNASAGAKDVANDQVEDFTIPLECNGTLANQEIKKEDQKFIIFPNPTYDEFFVGNIDQSSKEVRIRMFDMSGKLILSDSRESTSKKSFSTKSFQKGVYMIHIQQGDKVQVEKLMVR